MILHLKWFPSIVAILFSCWVVSTSLWPHRLQYVRVLCPPLSPGVCSNLCPLSGWCHPPSHPLLPLFSFCLQSFPAIGSFPVSQVFTSGAQNIGVSVSASVFPMNHKEASSQCQLLLHSSHRPWTNIFHNVAPRQIESESTWFKLLNRNLFKMQFSRNQLGPIELESNWSN